MESEARENQRNACKAKTASGRGLWGVGMDTGIAVHQKICVGERKPRGKSPEKCRIC